MGQELNAILKGQMVIIGRYLKPQSHQAYDQVTTDLRPKNGPIVDRTYDWSHRSYDWSQMSWVIARGKSVATRSNVYTCFLDASKAFDRVNHFKLFTTLSKRNVPMYIIRILIFWYTSQTMYVRWNNTMSTGFNVSNGVRQGGILSPYLFCIYVDELSKMLNNVHVGCFVGTMLVNHLLYADDLVLLSPSAAGLSILLSIC